MIDGALGELAAALTKAQASFPKIVKDREAKIESARGGYKYRYADLATILDAIRKPLSDNGLAYVQAIEVSEGHHVLVTRLLHTAGGEIQSRYALRQHERPQDMGSEITYARRYTLSALVGIASEEDDDAAAAQKSVADGTVAQPALDGQQAAHNNGLVNEAQVRRLWAIARSKGWSQEAVSVCIAGWKYDSTKTIQLKDYEPIITKLQAGPPSGEH